MTFSSSDAFLTAVSVAATAFAGVFSTISLSTLRIPSTESATSSARLLCAAVETVPLRVALSPATAQTAVPSIDTASQKPLEDPRSFQSKKVDSSIIWPVQAKEVSYLSGKVYGVSISSSRGERVKTISSGTVLSTGPYRGFGQVVFLQSKTGFIYVYGGLDAITPHAGQSLAFGDEIGTIGSVFFVTYMIGKCLNGFLADRLNIKRFLALGLFASASILVVLGFCSSFYLFAVLWGFCGWFQTFGAAPCIVSLNQWFSNKERGTLYGVWFSAHNIGTGLTYIITAYIVAAFGWLHQAPFYLLFDPGKPQVRDGAGHALPVTTDHVGLDAVGEAGVPERCRCRGWCGRLSWRWRGGWRWPALEH